MTAIDLSESTIVKRIPVESGLFDVVIDDEIDMACVANHAADSVTVISMETLEPIYTLPVGRRPSDMVIVSGRAVVPIENAIAKFPIRR